MATTRAAAGLIYGPSPHHIDHLAPLCQVMCIPLLCTEQEIAHAAQRYYPKLEVILCEYLTIAEFLVTHFDLVFYSMPRALFDEIFFFAQKFQNKKIHTLWCPHGNSDKGAHNLFMETLGKEEIALVYGQKMIDFFKEKNVFATLKGHVVLGNYRHQFYLQNQAFYDALIAQEVLRKLPQAKRTVLYAPTWQDGEKSSSFYAATPHLIEQLPSDWNLIIKPHPNLRLQDELLFEEHCDTYKDHPRVLFLHDFPLIYPLLQAVDLYIGDMSSIGYDFLTFDRPLFFLNHNKRNPAADRGLYLYQCGKSVLPEQYSQIYQIISNFEQFELRDFSHLRQQIYTYTFGPAKDLQTIKQEILNSYALFPDSDWSYF